MVMNYTFDASGTSNAIARIHTFAIGTRKVSMQAQMGAVKP